MIAVQEKTNTHTPERLGWVDAARGIAIVVVVFGHAWRGLEAAGLISDADLFARVDRFVYLFHMPVFFLLSGLFLPALLKNASALQAMGKQVMRLLYPLILWTYIFLLARYFAGAAANTPVGLRDVLTFPLPPVDHMWFLWALFCIQIPLIGLLFGAPEWRQRWQMPVGVFALSVLLLGWMPLPASFYAWFYNAIEYAPFVALGWLAATRRPLPHPALPLSLCALILFIALGVLTPTAKSTPLTELGLSIIMTSAFLIMVMYLHDKLEARSIAKLCRTLGAVSLTIFLAHTLFSATLRSALLALDIRDLSVHILLGTLIGVIGPYLLDRIARRFKFAKLLGF